MSLSVLIIAPSRLFTASPGLRFRLDQARSCSVVSVFCTAAAVARIWRPFPPWRRPGVRTHSVMDGGVLAVGWVPIFIPRGREVSSDLEALISTPLV